jgi:hypothetical protein
VASLHRLLRARLFAVNVQIDIAQISARGLNGPLDGAKAEAPTLGSATVAPVFLKGERAMGSRLSRVLTAMLVVAATLLMSGRSWAIFNVLGPSKDEWGLKYDVQVSDAGRDKVNIVFILAGEGRLKPIYSIELIALSKDTDSEGGHSYDVKQKFALKPTADGRRVGRLQMRREFLDRAQIRILTDRFDGHPQRWFVSYEVPISRFFHRVPGTAAAKAPLPASNAIKY